MTAVPPTPAKRRRRWLLVLAASAAPFVLLEIGLRLFYDARDLEREGLNAAKPHCARVLAEVFEWDPDETVRYTLRPSITVEDVDATYRTNALQLRGPEISKEKPAGTRRVLVLGDSYAFGLGVDQDDTITAALQRRLAEAGIDPVECLNMGVPGYHTGQELARLEREGFELDPDLVVLFYCPNDESSEAFHFDESTGVLYGDMLPLPYPWKRHLRHSAIYSLISHRVALSKLESGELKAMEPHQWPPTKERIERLFALCKEREIPILFLNLPVMSAGTAALKSPEYQYHANYDRLGALADEHQVPWIDLKEYLLQKVQGVELLFVRVTAPLDPHLNAKGYDLVAQAIVEKIRAMEWLR